jgi:transposase InsO family protein
MRQSDVEYAFLYGPPVNRKPNGMVESFRGGYAKSASLRQECLNAHWFLGLDDAERMRGAATAP